MVYFPKKQSNPISNLVASINSELGGSYLQVTMEQGKYQLSLTKSGLEKSELSFITFGLSGTVKFSEIYMYLLGILNGFRAKCIKI